MNEVSELWKKRASSYWNEAIHYLKLMANSGLLFTVYFLIIVGGYYYQQFLDWLPERFQAEWIFIVIFLFLITRTKIRSFVKEGDLVFLLPMEKWLSHYIRRSLIYSFCLQSAVLVIVMAILSPLFLQRIGDSTDFFIILLALLLVKGWNVIGKWASQRFAYDRDRAMNTYLLRLPINAVYLFLLFFKASFLLLGLVLLLMAFIYFFYFRKIRLHHSLKWEYLLEIEERMLHTFYRFANLFTDVPKLKHRTKERNWLNWVFSFIPYAQKQTFTYLYLRSFIRANDYFGIYVRILLVAAIFLLVVPIGYIHLIVYLAFIFLASLQMSTLQNHYQFILWIDLYPIDRNIQKKSFSKIVFSLLTLQVIVLTVVTAFLTGFTLLPLIYLLAGGVFSYICAFHLLNRKKKSI